MLKNLLMLIPNKVNMLNSKGIHKKNKITIKKLEQEADEIVNCAYKTYGNSYIHKYIYNKNLLKNLNLQEKLISYIAVYESNRVVGHVALEYPSNKYICEISHAFVDPQFRGKGYLTDLTTAVIKESQKRGDIGVYVRSLTRHIYSQKSAENNGFKTCALILSRIPALKFNNINDKNKKREALMIQFKYFKKQKQKYIYANEKYKELLKKIYTNLGINIIFKDVADENNISYKSTSIKTIRENDSVGIICINECSKDNITKIINEFNKLFNEGNKLILLKLKLCNKNNIFISNYMEQLGFIFAGVMPGKNNEDELILQYVNDDINFDSIHSNCDIGDELIEYIRKAYIDYNSKRRLSI